MNNYFNHVLTLVLLYIFIFMLSTLYQQDCCHWTFLWSVKSTSLLRKKGKVQLWRGVVVSTDLDAEHCTGAVPNEPETTSKRAWCRCTTTKEVSHQNATDSDTAKHRTAAKSLFENLSPTIGKRQKCHSSSPQQFATTRCVRKRGRCGYCLLSINLCLIA